MKTYDLELDSTMTARKVDIAPLNTATPMSGRVLSLSGVPRYP